MLINKTYGESDWSGGNTPPLALNPRGGPGKIIITATGTIDYDLEECNSDLQSGQTAEWATNATIDGATDAAPAVAVFDVCPRFVRIKVNSSTDATLQLDFVQTDV